MCPDSHSSGKVGLILPFMYLMLNLSLAFGSWSSVLDQVFLVGSVPPLACLHILYWHTRKFLSLHAMMNTNIGGLKSVCRSLLMAPRMPPGHCVSTSPIFICSSPQVSLSLLQQTPGYTLVCIFNRAIG